MYEVIQSTPKDIVLTYAIVLFSCAATFPLCSLILGAIKKGASKWR